MLNCLQFVNESVEQFCKKLKPYNIFQLLCYVLISSFITGLILGIVEFIERSVFFQYTLHSVNKLQGLIYSCTYLTFNYVITVIPFLLILVIILFLAMKYNTKLSFFSGKINGSLLIFSAFISGLLTYLIYTNCFVKYDVSFLSRSIVQSEAFKTVIFSLLIIIICSFIINLCIFITAKDDESRIKKLYLILNIALILLLMTVVAIFGLDFISVSINVLSDKLFSLYEYHKILLILFISGASFLISYITLMNITILFGLFYSHRVFKLVISMLMLLLFIFVYLTTVNFLFTHFHYNYYFRKAQFMLIVTALISLNILVLILMNYLYLTLNYFSRFNTGKTFLTVILLLALSFILIQLLKPNNNVLKAFVHRNIIFHQAFNSLIFEPLLGVKHPVHATLAVNKLCKNPQNSIDRGINYTLKDKVNIFVFTIDALRKDCSRCKDLMPHLNSLSKQSYSFDNCYTHGTHTMASLASINTSKYFGSIMHVNSPTLAEILSMLGYHTAFISANNLETEVFPLTFIKFKDKKIKTPIIKGYDEILMSGTHIEHTLEADQDVVRNLELFLNTDKQDPLFVWLHFFYPHDTPVSYVQKSLFAEKPFKEEYLRRVKLADKLLGESIQILKDKGLYEPSLIIFLADHGDEIKEHGGYYHKNSLYNEIIQVPLLIKMPYQDKGVVVSTPVSLLDIFPTITDLLNVNVDKLNLCGESLVPLLFVFKNRKKLPVSSIYLGKLAISDKKPSVPSIIMDSANKKYYIDRVFKHSIVDENNTWKLIINVNPEYYELYNLKEDPGERNNLADLQPDILQGLLAKFNKHLQLSE